MAFYTESMAQGFSVPVPNPPTDSGGGIDSGTYVTQTEFLDQGPSGRELAWAETTALGSVSSNTAADVAGLSITFTVGDRPVYVEASMPWLTASAAGSFAVIITDEANAAKQHSLVQLSAAGAIGAHARERLTVPGEYTRKVRVQRTAGTATWTWNFNLAAIISSICAVER